MAVLVDGVVGQVHEDVLRVFARGRVVSLRGEPGDALVENVDSERVARRDQGVDPHVELVAVDQQGLVQVHLAHELLQPHHLAQATGDENSPALRAAARLDDVIAAPLLLCVLLQLLKFKQPNL